jgi:hypothetical protein
MSIACAPSKKMKTRCSDLLAFRCYPQYTFGFKVPWRVAQTSGGELGGWPTLAVCFRSYDILNRLSLDKG